MRGVFGPVWFGREFGVSVSGELAYEPLVFSGRNVVSVINLNYLFRGGGRV